MSLRGEQLKLQDLIFLKSPLYSGCSASTSASDAQGALAPLSTRSFNSLDVAAPVRQVTAPAVRNISRDFGHEPPSPLLPGLSSPYSLV